MLPLRERDFVDLRDFNKTPPHCWRKEARSLYGVHGMKCGGPGAALWRRQRMIRCWHIRGRLIVLTVVELRQSSKTAHGSHNSFLVFAQCGRRKHGNGSANIIDRGAPSRWTAPIWDRGGMGGKAPINAPNLAQGLLFLPTH